MKTSWYFRVNPLGGKATRRVQVRLEPDYLVKTLAPSEQIWKVTCFRDHIYIFLQGHQT